jgi:hypothetical protein
MRIASLEGEAQKLAQHDANYEKEMTKIKAMHDAEILHSENEEETRAEQIKRLADMELAYYAEREEIRRQFADMEASRRQKEYDDEKAAHAERMREEEELRDMKFQSAAAGMEAIATLTEGHKQYASLYKASAIGQATINAVQSILKTMSATPYPFNIPLAAAQGAAAFAQVSKIASTKMYAGGMIKGRNTLIMANEEGEEAVLNTRAVRAVGGPSGVNSLNRGPYNTNNYDIRRSTSTTIIQTSIMTQKTYRDEILPVMRRNERRR